MEHNVPERRDLSGLNLLVASPLGLCLVSLVLCARDTNCEVPLGSVTNLHLVGNTELGDGTSHFRAVVMMSLL